MLDINVTPRRLNAIIAGIDALSGGLDESLEDALDQSAAMLLARIRRRFLAQTDADGNKWPESGAARKRRLKGQGGKTLFDTGSLFHSLQLTRKLPGERAVGVLGGASNRKTGVSVELYGRVHQLGLGAQTKREFLGISEEDGGLMFRVFTEKVARLLTKL
jgi:hypothetical protein